MMKCGEGSDTEIKKMEWTNENFRKKRKEAKVEVKRQVEKNEKQIFTLAFFGFTAGVIFAYLSAKGHF